MNIIQIKHGKDEPGKNVLKDREFGICDTTGILYIGRPEKDENGNETGDIIAQEIGRIGIPTDLDNLETSLREALKNLKTNLEQKIDNQALTTVFYEKISD